MFMYHLLLLLKVNISQLKLFSVLLIQLLRLYFVDHFGIKRHHSQILLLHKENKQYLLNLPRNQNLKASLLLSPLYKDRIQHLTRFPLISKLKLPYLLKNQSNRARPLSITTPINRQLLLISNLNLVSNIKFKS